MGSDGDDRDLVKLHEQGPWDDIHPMVAVKPSVHDLGTAFGTFLRRQKPKLRDFGEALRCWNEVRRQAEVKTVPELAKELPELRAHLETVFGHTLRIRVLPAFTEAPVKAKPAKPAAKKKAAKKLPPKKRALGKKKMAARRRRV